MGRMKDQVIEQAEAEAPQTGTEVAEIQAASVIASSPMLMLIERAARDPSIDVGKMRELLAMRRDEERDLAIKAFERDMNLVQREIEPVRKDADNEHTRSKYATYNALDAAIRPIYVAKGFSVSFDTEETPKPDTLMVVAIVAHNQGHSRVYRIPMPADGKGARGGEVMTKTHATGSAVTYGRRYLLSMIFNLSTMEDDDGNAAGAKPVTVKPAAKAAPQEKQKPHEIPRPAGIKPVDWGGKFVGHLKQCDSVEEIDEWKKLNAQALKDMEKMAKNIYDRIVAVEKDQRDTVTGGQYPP